jgi:hypothetical protein
MSDVVTTSVGSGIAVELAKQAGFMAFTSTGDSLLIKGPLDSLAGTHSKQLETTSAKTLLITLSYNYAKDDAALGFFKSSIHG